MAKKKIKGTVKCLFGTVMVAASVVGGIAGSKVVKSGKDDFRDKKQDETES
ncbi:MAG: hypothetical protein IKR18_11090 [Bacteroidaceae bacterium]|nr:hypothetical protein [Bacteroidaceae bacterium]